MKRKKLQRPNYSFSHQGENKVVFCFPCQCWLLLFWFFQIAKIKFHFVKFSSNSMQENYFNKFYLK
jgi:hypothetical protein